MDAKFMQTGDDSKPAEPEPLQARPTAALPPRKPKLQPGDFFITLPKPPGAVPDVPDVPEAEPASQPSEQTAPETVSARPMDESNRDQNRDTEHSVPEPTQPSSPGQAAETSSSPQPQHLDQLLQDGSIHAVDSAEVQPSSSAALPGGHTPMSGAAQSSGMAPSGGSGQGANTAQHSTPSSTPAVLEPFPEREYSSGNRYGAAAARKEEAQELALEQAILVRCPIQCVHCSTLKVAHQHEEIPLCLALVPYCDRQLSPCVWSCPGGSLEAR